MLLKKKRNYSQTPTKCRSPTSVLVDTEFGISGLAQHVTLSSLQCHPTKFFFFAICVETVEVEEEQANA